MQSKPKRAPLISRICFVFGAFTLVSTYLIAEGVLLVAHLDSQWPMFKAIVWVVGLAISLAFFTLGSRFAQEQSATD